MRTNKNGVNKDQDETVQELINKLDAMSMNW